MGRGRIIFGLLLVIASCAVGRGIGAAEVVETAKVDALAKPLVDGGWIYGAAVGLISDKGTQISGYGRISEKDPTAPGEDTEFEIGSISKVFTGLLLAQMVEEHEVALTDPVQKLLGDSITMPKGEREITLVDLATHTSGLPRMPGNFSPKDLTNPYADYTVEQMGKFISSYKLPRQPGARSEYSNLGMGLLGHALALQSGIPYEALLRKRICEPLGMNDTRITLDGARTARLAQGHDADGDPVANWDLPTLAGAGAIRSTAADMLKFVAANLGLAKTPFDPAIALSQSVHFETPDESGDSGLAWVIRRKDHVIWHNGQTGGYHAFAGFSVEKRVGVVVLLNTASMYSDALGFRLLKLLISGDLEPLKLPRAVELAPEDLEPFVGHYKLGALSTATVTREGNRLLMRITGQPKLKYYPQSKTRFFCRALEVPISFEADDQGKIKLVIHQNGRDTSAPKTK